MQILFLGTSSMLGFPRTNCTCPQCQSVNLQDHRLRSSVLIDSKILLDCGSDILKQVERYKIKIDQLQGIIITHHHFDHTGGLKKILPLLTSDCKLYISHYHYNKLSFLKQYLSQIEFISQDKTYKIADNKIKFIRLLHNKSKRYYPYYSPIINRKFIYATDFSKLNPQFFTAISQAKIIVLNGSMFDRSSFGHLSMRQQILQIKAKISNHNNKQFYFTHNGHTNIPHFQLEKRVQDLGGSSFKLAYDGLELELN